MEIKTWLWPLSSSLAPTDSPSYSTIGSLTDLSLATSTLLPAYSSSTEPSDLSSQSETSSLVSTSDKSRSPSLPELSTNHGQNKPFPPAKPPRLFKTKKGQKMWSPEIEEDETNSLDIKIICQGRPTEVGLSSPNCRAPSLSYFSPGVTER